MALDLRPGSATFGQDIGITMAGALEIEDPYGNYGIGVGTRSVGAVAPLVLSVAVIVARLGGSVAGQVIAWLVRTFGRQATVRGGRILQMAPNVLRGFLGALGIKEGVDIVLELVDDETEVTPIVPVLPDIPEVPVGGPLDLVGRGGIVGSWVANGITFYRLLDGRLAVQNLRGRWKVWRPRKPIVLYPTGVADLRTLVRADKAVAKQAKGLANLLRRRGFRVGRGISRAAAVAVDESGPGSVYVSARKGR